MIRNYTVLLSANAQAHPSSVVQDSLIQNCLAKAPVPLTNSDITVQNRKRKNNIVPGTFAKLSICVEKSRK